MQKSSILTSILVWWICSAGQTAYTLPRGKEYRRSSEAATSKDAASAEPSCEELKAMWRFSKRQSRAAEITNEIPMYRDPFTENIWEPFYYPTSRSIGGMRLGRFGPVYGRVVHKVPLLRIQDPLERKSAYEALSKLYADPITPEPRRRLTAFRLSGGGHMSPAELTPQSGSFQHLKELIRTERARELHEQRMAEEAAARAAALKELTGSAHRGQSGYHDMNYNYDTDGHEELQSSYVEPEGLLAFPDLLAPAARIDPDSRYFEDYGYSRERPKSHSSSYFDSSSFNNDLDGMVL